MKAHFVELDPETRRYLLRVRDNLGRGMPGLFLPRADFWPWVGLVLGLGLIVGILFFTLPPLGDPLTTAMWQMAFLLPGVWMVLAAARVWIAASGTSRPGHFLYADAKCLYECKGYQVVATSLSELEKVNAIDTQDEGKYTGTRCRLVFPDGVHTVLIGDGKQAVQFLRFVDKLLYSHAQSQGASASAAGFAARNAALAETNDAPPERDEREAYVGEPPTPRRVRPAPTGLLALTVIAAATIGGVFALKALNTTWRDDALHQIAVGASRDDKPLALREYLMDPRNTRHRAEAEKALAELYDPPAARILAQATDQEMKTAMSALVRALGKAKQPLASIRVKEDRNVDGAGIEFLPAGAAAREDLVRKRLATTLTRVVGERLVEAVAIEGDDIPAMIEVRYRQAFEPDTNRIRVEWTVSLRERPEATALVKTLPARTAWNPGADDFAQAIGPLMLAMLGSDDAS